MKTELMTEAAAAKLARSAPSAIAAAMTAGTLKWKRQGKNRATTSIWVKEWLANER